MAKPQAFKLAGTIQIRGGTQAQCVAANPRLAERELCLETDTGQFKIGNGTAYYVDLPYGGLKGEAGGISQTTFDILSNLVASHKLSNDQAIATLTNSLNSKLDSDDLTSTVVTINDSLTEVAEAAAEANALIVADLAASTGSTKIGVRQGGNLSEYLIGSVDRVVNSVAQLRALSKLFNTHARTLGYYAPNDRGAAKYYLDATDTTSVDDGGSVIVATDGGRWKLIVEQSVDVRQFGARGTFDVNAKTGPDDSVPCQKWMDFIHTGGHTGHVSRGIYYIPSGMVKAPSFDCPVLTGDGGKRSVFVGPATGSGFQIIGGSGGPSGGHISNIGFQSLENTGYALEVVSQCMLQFESCWFGKSRVGAMLHNNYGGFTELITFHNCEFNLEARQALVYRRTGGTDSFHGSGLVDCTINEAVGETLPKIEIGGELSTNQDIILYNAPLSFQCWKQAAAPVIRNSGSRLGCYTHGNITFEAFGGNVYEIVDSSTLQNLHHVGNVQDFNGLAKRGGLTLMETIELRADGVILGRRLDRRIEYKQLPAQGGLVTYLYAVSSEVYKVIVTLTASGDPWTRTYELTCLCNPNLPQVIVSQNLLEFYGGNFEAPTFSMTNGMLTATAATWPANKIYVDGSVCQTGLSAAQRP